jgi:hypothetical protein
MTSVPWNKRSLRRILIDTQIPDWDPGFLARYDVDEAFRACITAGADAVMVYFQSHTGLCNWPSRSGKQHAAFRGRDLVAETMACAQRHELPICAYYSVNFNNQAWIEHPEWRLQAAGAGMIGGGLLVRERYGICCLNHPEYREFIEAQVSEILAAYEVEALFYDMVWWMGLCLCDHCRDRLRSEESIEIPEQINWLNPDWCRFQAARERWLTEFAHELRDLARRLRPGISIYHNFALGMMNWTRGVSFDSAAAHDFLGGDFYGGRDEQLVVSKLMINLSESRPVEFMTTVTENLAEHESLKTPDLLAQQSLAASACASAVLMIAGIDPDGELNPAAFDHIQQAFSARRPWDGELGGEPVEQIAVYYSDDSKMSFAENGLPVAASQDRPPIDYPHFSAVRGACKKLQRAHLPFGVITRKQLGELHRYPVIVLPDILRMSPYEAEAFRAYVHGGGRLYASRYTSLTESNGTRHDDFMLSDLFGCHFEAIEQGRMVYLDPADEACSAAIAPQRYLCQPIAATDNTGFMRLRPVASDSPAEVLATLNVPYGHPSHGSVEAADWSSIHSSPPCTDTGAPALVRNREGEGCVIYSAADIESGEGAAHERLFISLVRELLPCPPAFEADAHPSVWMTVFDQADRGRQVLSLLNYAKELPVIPGPASVRLNPPPGCRFTGLLSLPEKNPMRALIDSDGGLTAEIGSFGLFAMLAATYEPRDE